MTLRYWFFYGWQIYKRNLKNALVVTTIFFIYAWLLKLIITYAAHGNLVSLILQIIAGPALNSGIMFFCLKLVRRTPVCQKDFLAGFLVFGKIWLTGFLLTLITLIGFALFIVPGIIWGLKYGLSLISVLDKNFSPLQGIKFSGKITYGYKSKLFVLLITGIASAVVLQLPIHYIGLPTLTCKGLCLFLMVGLVPYLLFFLLVLPWLSIVSMTAYDGLRKRYE